MGNKTNEHAMLKKYIAYIDQHKILGVTLV